MSEAPLLSEAEIHFLLAPRDSNGKLQPGDKGFRLKVDRAWQEGKLDDAQAEALLNRDAEVQYARRQRKAEAKERQRVHGQTAPGRQKNTDAGNGVSVAGESTEIAAEIEPLDLRALLSGPVPETDWFWRGWLARGELAMIVADPKVGKSLLLLGLANAIRRGDEFLGAQCHRGRVGFLDFENPLGEVAKRLHGFGITADDHEGIFYFHMPQLDLASAEAQEILLDLIDRYQLDLLVIDSARRAAPGLDENDARSVSAAFSPLRRVSAESGTTIAVVHHARKRVGDNPSEAGQMVRGSGDLVASVDALIFLRAKEAGSFTMETVSRRGLPHEPILVRIEGDDDGAIRLVNEGAVAIAEDKVEAMLSKIIVALNADGGTLERPVIAMRVGTGPDSSTFKRALALGLQRGQLAKSEHVVGKPTVYALASGVYE